jgi:hypothetical protein
MICPNPDCQMKLEKHLAAERSKREERDKLKGQQLAERKQGLAGAKV